MLAEENPGAFPSPEQKPEDVSKKNKKPKKKKKNNENPAQPNEHPQPQVSSEPLVVVAPNPEIKSNEESSLPKKKKPHKKKSVINAEVAQPIREESKPLLDLEIRKEAETVEVSIEGAETVIGKRKQKGEIGKLDEVVVVENALKHDHDHAQEKLNTVDSEEKTGKKRKRKKNKSKLDGSQSNEPGETAVDGSQSNEPGETAVDGSQSNEPGETAVDGLQSNVPGEIAVQTLDGSQSNEPGETAVQTSIIDGEVRLVEPTIPGNTRPVNLSELENEYLDRKWKQRKRKAEFLEKTKAQNDKAIEIHLQRPVGPITEPSTDPAVVMDPHLATPVDTEQKISKKRKKKKRKCESEIPAQKSVISTTVPLADSKDQAISIDPACHTAAPPIDVAVPEQKASKKKRKRKGGLKSNTLESDRGNSGSTAGTSVRRTKRVKVTNAPHYQHGISSMICWACRETNHTIQQCQKLKHLSKDEEICFFCGEIGHSLGKCSVYKAGGGRLARCLFCNAHGHFSYNCPGNRHDPQVQLPVEAEKSEVTTVTEGMKEKSSAEVTTVTEGMKEKSSAEVTTVTEGIKLSV